MARAVATTKQTGGGGYLFEDKVAARFMAMMLAGHPPLDEASGLIQRIDFQNRTDGWRLDDLVLSLSGRRGESHFALSVKSNYQVTAAGFPNEFVTVVWEQWLGKDTDIFDRSRDHLGLVVGALSQKVHTAWNGLLSQILDADPQRILSRLKKPRATNKLQRNLFRSLACNLAVEAVSDEETVSLMRRLRILDFDFETVPSVDEQRAVSFCRDVLESQSRADAGDLWDRLLLIARELGPTGGTLELLGLIERLRGKFRLKEFPDYASDVQRINQASERLLEELTDRIAGTVTLDRSADLNRISSLLECHRGIVLLGASGSGKSVLTKKVAVAAKAQGPVAWFDAQTLDEPTFATIERSLCLRHSLANVFSHITALSALLFLDGVDRFSEDAHRNAASLIKASCFEDGKSPWKVILTCQPEDWDAAAATLLKLGVCIRAIKTVIVDFPTGEELKPVWKAFRNLQTLANRRDLSLVLRNVHLLNVVASNAAQTGSISSEKWVGESHLIRWFWRDVVEAGENGRACSVLLQQLARSEADGPTVRVPVSQLSISEAAVLGELEKMRICRVRDERVSFTHDLFGDWARLRILLGEAERLDEFLADRITTPRWFKAVRLRGLDLLEQSGDVTAWRGTMKRLCQATGRYDLRTDLLLESVVFAANAEPLLEAIYQTLIDDAGLLLRRLLNRFLYVATFPNPLMNALSGTGIEASSAAATTDRNPDWPRWPALLMFLASHASDVAALAPKEGALVANTWLRKTDRTWPWRKAAALLAVVIAEHCLLAKERRYRHREDEECKAVLCSLVAACAEQPEEVTSILLSLCKRARPANTSSDVADKGSSKRRLTLRVPGRSQEVELPPPWPDGPSERVDETIQSVLLDSGTLMPLFPDHASLAREVILALTIKHPVPSEVTHYAPFHRDYGTESPHQWNAHIWLRGPFLALLIQQPQEGLDTILRLVNHATERWAEAIGRREGGKVSVTIYHEGKSRDLLGDSDVYFWYLDSHTDAHCVVCALMALEKWFYVQLEQGQSVAKWVDFIWQHARSVAFCGVMSAVGLKHPELFEGPLKPLLGTWAFHNWEYYHYHLNMRGGNFSSGFVPGFWSSSGEWLFNLARDWYQLPHRKKSFREIALNLLFTNSSLRPHFAEVQKRWDDELTEIKRKFPNADLIDLENLVRLFKVENWRTRREGDHILLECPGSDAEERARTEALERSSLRMRFTAYPLKCRRILDGDEPLSASELEAFWADLVQLSAYSDREDEQPSITSASDVVTGGIAVLMVLHPEWLEGYPERRRWCDNQLAAILSHPPSPGPLESEFTVLGNHSESFCADIAAAQWARAPEDPAARWFVANVATSFRYETVGILMRRVTRERQRLGLEYGRLESLLVLWAALRDVWNCTRSIQYPWNRAASWGRRALKAFVEKKIPCRLESWDRIARAANRQAAKMRFRQSRRHATEGQPHKRTFAEFLKLEMNHEGFDLHLLNVAFRDLPTVSDAESEEDRDHVLVTHQNLLGITLHRASVEFPRDHYLHSYYSHPNEFDRWLLERIATLSAQLGPVEESGALWKPVLNLGPEAHGWVESYLHSWFSHGSKAAPSVEAFSSTWQIQIAHALASPRWQGRSSDARHFSGELFTELMGLGWFSYQIIGDAKFRGTIASMSSLYREWALHCLRNSDAIRSFARFLRCPSATDLLTDGMVWILGAVGDYDVTDWDRAEREKDDLVDLVEHWWKSVGRDRSSADAGRTAALGLLKILADQQHPRALEIQDRLARS